MTCSLLFFALAAVAPGREAIVTYKESAKDAALDPAARAKAEQTGRQVVKAMSDSLVVNMPRAMFLLMPFFAVLTWLFYRKAEGYYVPHLHYSLHFHALMFLIFTAALTFAFTGKVVSQAGGLVPLAIFPYHYIGLRRVFGGSRAVTAAKGTAIALFYFLAIAAVVITLLLLEVWRIKGSVS